MKTSAPNWKISEWKFPWNSIDLFLKFISNDKGENHESIADYGGSGADPGGMMRDNIKQ